MNKLIHSDNLEYIKSLPNNSVDAVITDSPYGLGKEPDPLKLIQDWATKGYHEVKGKGFMGKQWDAFVPQPALWKECYRVLRPGGHLLSFFGTRTYDWGTLAIRLAGFEIRDCIQWIYGSGFPKAKSHLKPANEPICVARKPGAMNELNVDECRIELNGDHKGGLANRTKGIGELQNESVYGKAKRSVHNDACGRWPANLVIDEEVSLLIDKQSGISGGDKRTVKVQTGSNGSFTTQKEGQTTACYNDKGGASRFFYVAKASPSERKGNPHPTVKPVKLMEYLVKLYCRRGGIVLDPHCGSGTTAIACMRNERQYIVVDADQFSIDIANKRISEEQSRMGMFQ